MMISMSLPVRRAVVRHTKREAFKYNAILVPLLKVQWRTRHTKRPVLFGRVAVADHLSLFALIGELCKVKVSDFCDENRVELLDTYPTWCHCT
jgi:hypothetical protein